MPSQRSKVLIAAGAGLVTAAMIRMLLRMPDPERQARREAEEYINSYPSLEAARTYLTTLAGQIRATTLEEEYAAYDLEDDLSIADARALLVLKYDLISKALYARGMDIELDYRAYLSE